MCRGQISVVPPSFRRDSLLPSIPAQISRQLSPWNLLTRHVHANKHMFVDPHFLSPPSQLQHLATLFEEAEDEVDYASLVTFASEQPAALRAASAVSRLRGHLLAVRRGGGGEGGVNFRAILEVFAIGGAEGGGGGSILRQAELDAALNQLGLE